MKKGDLVCSKDKSVVGVVTDFSYMLKNVTILVLWNDVPTAQGCKTFTLHNDNVILLPKGTKVIKHFKKYDDSITYRRYDAETGVIHGDVGCFTVWDLNGTCDLEFEFMEDVTTKNNKQYTTLDIEPWEIMDLIYDVTKDKKGFEKLYCDMVLYQTLSYTKDKDKTRLNKIGKYLEELINEVSTKEI